VGASSIGETTPPSPQLTLLEPPIDNLDWACYAAGQQVCRLRIILTLYFIPHIFVSIHITNIYLTFLSPHRYLWSVFSMMHTIYSQSLIAMLLW
jgi:hypothetical protein